VSRSLFLIRHGRTGGNRQRYVGWEDVPLDQEGVRQAAAVAAAVAADRIDAVYASPLSRAVDTARPLAEARGLEVQVRPALKEIDYGRYQGMLKADQPLRLRHEHRVEPMPGGESLADVYRRIEGAWRELREELAHGRSIAVVGHFWSNRMLAAVMRGVPFEEVFLHKDYKPENGSVYVLDWEGRGSAGLRLAAGGWRIEGDPAP
jgi:broad specificity phosphatase PhoE